MQKQLKVKVFHKELKKEMIVTKVHYDLIPRKYRFIGNVDESGAETPASTQPVVKKKDAVDTATEKVKRPYNRKPKETKAAEVLNEA
jgi:hypothetical protein